MREGEPVSSADPLERLQDLWVLGLETAVHGYILRRVLPEKDQRVADVVSIIDRGRNFLEHLFLSLRFNARRSFDKHNRHTVSPFVDPCISIVRVYTFWYNSLHPTRCYWTDVG